MAARLPVPQELMLESYERRLMEAEIDNVNLTLILAPGHEGIGAVVKGFIDAIANHDLAVKNVEDQWLALVGIRRDFNKKNRVYRNLDGAWNTLSADNAENYAEYKELVPKMVNMEERLKVIKDQKVKIKMETEWAHYNELLPVCSRLEQAQNALSEAREERDAAQALLMKSEAQLIKYRSEERALAAKITDDHVVADEKGLQIAATFPNIQPNNILHLLNGVEVEDKPYKEIMLALKKLKPPHTVVFRRYDYRFDAFSRKWNSLADLRAMGVCIDDPMMAKAELVRCAAIGDFNGVKEALLRGEDPNSQDYTGATAMIASAANRQSDICELLFRAGGDLESRDSNMLTPLLAAVKKGYLDIVRQLIDYGAARDATDKNRRNALYFSLMSGNLNMVKFFLKPTNSNEVEALWGFTPMHIAANAGDLPLIKLLLTFGASIYRKCNQGRTAEDVAREAGFEEVTLFLESERFSAPAQLAYKDPNLHLNIWIGEFNALDPRWSTDVGITEVICMPTLKSKPLNVDWLKSDEHCKIFTKIVDINDTDTTDASWETFAEALPKLATHLKELMKKGDAEILICDPSGNSTAASLLAVVLLMVHQQKITDTLAACAVARPALKLSFSLRKGLEIVQRTVDEKKLKRLNAKIRNAVILSGGF